MGMMLAAVAASGYKVSIGDAAITALMGYVVVFFGLFSLMLVIMGVGRIMVARSKKAAPAVKEAAAPAPAAPAAPPAPGSAGKIKLYDTSDRDAAMIMAIVAHKMGKPLNELRFISIKEVK